MTSHHDRGATPRPALLLREIGSRYPQAWRQYDTFRQGRGQGDLPDWPEWCYCPMAAAYAIVSGGGAPLDPRSGALGEVQALAALAAWRPGLGIYRFDPTLAAAIMDTPIEALPTEVLYRLPEWCVYVEAPPGLRILDIDLSGGGFFAHLECDAATGRPELRILLDSVGGGAHGFPLHLSEPTLSDSVASFICEAIRNTRESGDISGAEYLAGVDYREIASGVLPVLNLVLYLCADQADLGADRPARPTPTRTRRGWKLFPPDRPRQWEVGVRIGAALRAAHLAEQVQADRERTDTGRARPRPHIRRAHWHTYRTGPERVGRVLRWLPPIPINLDSGDTVPTVHPVRGEDGP